MSDGARLLGLPGAIAIVMGGMIGTGVFMLPVSLAPYGWNAVIGWLATIGGCLCLAYVIAALARMHAGPVGPAEIVEHSFGRPMGFLIAFSYWVSCWTGNATIALGAVSYLSAFFPALGLHPALAALALIWLIVAVNLASVRLIGQVQVATTLLKLVPLIVVGALIPLVIARTGTSHVNVPAMPISLGAINNAASMALFALVGFEAAVAASHKIADPARNVARATLIGTGLVGLIYLVICSGITLLLPPDKVARSTAPFALFVATYWAPGPAATIGLFAAISAIGCLNGWTLIQGEMLLEMARRGMMPGWFARTGRSGIAVRGLIFSAILASLLVIFSSNQSLAGMFSFVLLLATSVTLWLYLAVAAAALKERVTVPIAIVGLIYSVWTLAGTGWQASLLGLVLMLSGLPFYWAARLESERLQPAT